SRIPDDSCAIVSRATDCCGSFARRKTLLHAGMACARPSCRKMIGDLMRLVFICMAGLSLVSLVACGSASVAGDSGAGGASGGTPATGGASSGGASSGGASSGGSSSGSGGSMPIPYDQWRACVSDEDCVTVPQNTCCGCQPFGVNKEYEEAARTEFAKFNASSCPPGLGCPSFPCPPDPVPIC